ncbi:toll/interleukin-1 receptor domain-containing protein [Phormidesmis priestleyi]|uniref:toll/interleukin-1 receptor domain-containing protein n=1 Tax=Phormidesmis priestleyi TaxID=268141 RepID=UPI00083B9D38|nr:toll/interleukin-1 receptor domain-containing protein [Phormidesmis priestleyi]
MSENSQFDVFLCHNSNDKTEVKEVGYKLKKLGLVPWLDEWELIPGRSVRRSLEAQIEQVFSVAVFVGENGIGPWQDEEISAFLYQVKERNCPIIPVLLQNAPQKPNLPPFLRDRLWVDFRKNRPDPIEQLFSGIKGQKFIEYLHCKLENLLTKKNILEQEIRDIEEKLHEISSSNDQVNPKLKPLLAWLTSRESIAEKCGAIALEKFPKLKQEVKKKDNLSRFFLEISTHLEFISMSVERDDIIFIDEPALSPTLANPRIYKFASLDVYEEAFKLIKDKIPSHIDTSMKELLEARIDYAVSRLLMDARNLNNLK